jgi:hypothetical protein
MALAYRLADTPCGWRDGTHIPLAAAGLRSTDPITVNVTTEGTITGPVAEVDMAASYTIEATLNGKTYQWTGQRPKPHGDGFIFRFKAT